MTGDADYSVTIHEEWTSIRGLLLFFVMEKMFRPRENWAFGVLSVEKRTLRSIEINDHQRSSIYSIPVPVFFRAGGQKSRLNEYQAIT